MNCTRCRKLIMEHFDHAIGDRDRGLLDGHMDSCPECRALMDDLRGILPTLESAPPAEPPSNLETLVMKRIRSAAEPPYGPDNLIKAMYASMGAAAALLSFAATAGPGETGILSLLSRGAAGLNSMLAEAWKVQVAYSLLSGLISPAVSSLFNTAVAAFIIAAFATIVTVIKKAASTGTELRKSRIDA